MTNKSKSKKIAATPATPGTIPSGKCVLIAFHDDGSCEVSYFRDNVQVNRPKKFDSVPVRLEFFAKQFITFGKPKAGGEKQSSKEGGDDGSK